MKARHTMSPTRFSPKLRAGALAFVVASSLAWARHGSLLAQELSAQDMRTTSDSARSAEAQFLAENTVAMNKMMRDMALKPTGDIDSDFVAMMVPHHQMRSIWHSPFFAMVATRRSGASRRKS